MLYVVSGMVMDGLAALVPYEIWIRERESYTRNVSRLRIERTKTGELPKKLPKLPFEDYIYWYLEVSLLNNISKLF